MVKGWIRAYAQEREQFSDFDRHWTERNARAEFREGFTTELRDDAAPGAAVLQDLPWGTQVELPDGLSEDPWTHAFYDGQDGYVRSEHVVEVAYVKRAETVGSDSDLKTTLQYDVGDGSRELIWGDCVQILERGEDTCLVRARGSFGHVPTDDLTSDPLLEVYFVDVGQGDGVLVRTPDGRHLLVDGGLERKKQLTGKNAADFVDWKFFRDYGDFRVRLDSMTASHSDNDHYGGLHDLVRETQASDRELDCVGVDIATLHHPGLSRWEGRDGVDPPHVDGLGPARDGYFLRLLGNRQDADDAIVNHADHELSTYWKWFFRDVLGNSDETAVERVGVDRQAVADGDDPPAFWPSAAGCSIHPLGPVTVERDGQPALKDLGSRSINTNGHSICLRIDYHKARILLTGDLNKDSMDWLTECYGEDRLGEEWVCDVAKACHHGSHDISYRFLKALEPACTVISSGDAEGHSHPRPEIVGASAVTGFRQEDEEKDRLVTPLVYMTEAERSVSLGAVHRIDFAGLPVPDGAGGQITVSSGILPGRHLDELTSAKRLSPTEQAEIDAAPEEDQEALEDALVARLRDLEEQAIDGDIEATYYCSVPQGPLSAKYVEKDLWRSRVMEKNHYGLVNVRTDGELILCATLDETEEDWILHTFPARFETT